MNPAAGRIGQRDPFYWRRAIVPSSNSCTVEAAALPPSTLSSNTITLNKEQFSSGILSFTVSWKPPLYSNGELERYELCIGENALSGTDDCTAPSDCLYVQLLPANVVGCAMLNHLVANGSIVGDINYHVQMGTELLFMQVYMYIYIVLVHCDMMKMFAFHN